MERTMEEMKVEAIARLKALKVMPNVVNDFKAGVVNESENIGYLYWLNEEEQKMVKEFEQENEALVYHVIHQFTNIGEMYCLLYVHKDDEEWEMDREDLKEGQALAYVINKTMPDCSEFGCIGVQPSIGGVRRIW